MTNSPSQDIVAATHPLPDEVVEVTPEMLAAFVAWEPPCDFDATKPARALGLIRAAFFAGWITRKDLEATPMTELQRLGQEFDRDPDADTQYMDELAKQVREFEFNLDVPINARLLIQHLWRGHYLRQGGTNFGEVSDTHVLVPRVPTEAMLDSYWEQTGESREMRERTHAYMRRYWSAMIAATEGNAK